MSQFTLVAESRENLGRSASRCLRRSEKLPGVIYGGGEEPTSITFRHDDVFHALEHEAFYSSIIELKIDGKKQKAVIKDLQRHAYKPKLVHIDFLRVNDKTEIHVHVPLHFTGECPAVEEGGVVNHLVNEVEVICFPKDLPEYVEVDLSNLQLDETIHLSQLKIPEGVKLASLVHGNDAGIANVHIPRAIKADEELEAAASEVPAGEVPASEVASESKTEGEPKAE